MTSFGFTYSFSHLTALISILIEYGIIGEGSQILTNQKRENSAFSRLIGRNLRPFPDNTVLYWLYLSCQRSSLQLYSSSTLQPLSLSIN